jgi:dihydrofolate reductase
MRKLIVSMNVTLDGYMSGSECELDWHFQYWTEEMAESLCEQLSKADTILLGRVTYNAMARYWLSKVANPSLRGEDFAFANMMNSYDKIVFSKTITLPEWSNTKLANGNLKDEVKLLKKKIGKDIIVYGSGRLVTSLIKSGMVDEYQLWLHPVVLGKGKPLFKNLHSRLYMKMMNIKTFSSGVVILYYQTNKTNENEICKQKHKRRILKGQF